jgi:hypothetical protein
VHVGRQADEWPKRRRRTGVLVDRTCCARAYLDGLYDGTVVGERARSVEELAERMRSAGPPTDDDVTVLPDGRRIDSREAAEAWLAELDAIRAAEAANQALDD